jgi:hypothetical protein
MLYSTPYRTGIDYDIFPVPSAPASRNGGCSSTHGMGQCTSNLQSNASNTVGPRSSQPLRPPDDSLPGSLIRIGPNDLVTSDPEILRKTGAPRSPYRRSDWYQALRVDRENILSERDEDRHAKLRNKMAAGVLHLSSSAYTWYPVTHSPNESHSTQAKKTPPSNKASTTPSPNSSISSKPNTSPTQQSTNPSTSPAKPNT